jgi:hypothetical protein
MSWCARKKSHALVQFRFGSRLNRDLVRSVDPDPESERIQIQECKNDTHKKGKKFHVLKCGCSLLRAEGFSCSLEVLYGGLGISKLEFSNKKVKLTILTVNFPNFWSSG